MKKRILTGAVVIAGVAVLVAAGFKWRHLSAWYALQTEFERVSEPTADVQEYRHNKTGIVFAIEGAKK